MECRINNNKKLSNRYIYSLYQNVLSICYESCLLLGSRETKTKEIKMSPIEISSILGETLSH